MAAECRGHPAGPYDPMGVTVYCDGSCRPSYSVASLIAAHGPNPQEVGAVDGTEDDYGDLLLDVAEYMGYYYEDDPVWQRFQEVATGSTATDMATWIEDIRKGMTE